MAKTHTFVDKYKYYIKFNPHLILLGAESHCKYGMYFVYIYLHYIGRLSGSPQYRALVCAELGP